MTELADFPDLEDTHAGDEPDWDKATVTPPEAESAHSGDADPPPATAAHIDSDTEVALPGTDPAEAGSGPDELDQDAVHRQALREVYTTRVAKTFYVCALLGDRSNPAQLNRGEVVQRLRELTDDETLDKPAIQNNVGQYAKLWREWITARETAQPIPATIGDKQAQTLDDIYLHLFGDSPEQPTWMSAAAQRDVDDNLPRTQIQGDTAPPEPATSGSSGDVVDSELSTGAATVAPQPPAEASPHDPADIGDVQGTGAPQDKDVPPARILVELATRGREAQPIQTDPALFADWSADEIIAEREVAEWIRARRRKARKIAVAAQLADESRDRKALIRLRAVQRRERRIARKALAAQRRKTSPHAQIASLFTYQFGTTLALASVVAAGMAWSATNVQRNIVAQGLTSSDLLYWTSYLLEAMISICLVVIMVGTPKLAEWGIRPHRIGQAELGLLAITIGLNTYPFLADKAWGQAVVHSVAPGMIGGALLIHHRLSAAYGNAIQCAAAQLPPDDLIAGTDPYLDAVPLSELAPPTRDSR
ncbi:hypothetical protein [Nocardia sp. XZ_19_369]|uniref:hypothetical protein n=1 Tax=Nocardia sp. XZ_19_369 TaxID=2769487 RepID=UPI0018901C3B|nr:hypothetical protein [Nocardia sp. XZ_19_369]